MTGSGPRPPGQPHCALRHVSAVSTQPVGAQDPPSAGPQGAPGPPTAGPELNHRYSEAQASPLLCLASSVFSELSLIPLYLQSSD